MRNHSELADWKIVDVGKKPMGFVSTDRAIYDHLERLSSSKKINLKTTNPADFFAPERKVKCLASWMAAMDTKNDTQFEW